MTVSACPDCDSASIAVRTNNRGDTETRANYRCTECGHLFDDPLERDPGPGYQGGHSRRGLAGELARIGEQRGENA